MSVTPRDFNALFASRSVLLAPMEDVTDPVFRAICRRRGADLCFTEFVNVENLLDGCSTALARLSLTADDTPTAIQIYGSDRARLAEAAVIAEAAGPAFIDINCGCWVPRVAARGAGAAWLRDPAAMVAMVRDVVARCALPVTVKTRIGFGNETQMPIVDLARRLEDVGVRAITVHCRTAKMGHDGAADWSWAARVREVVSIPVVVNGDIGSAALAKRALDETGCTAVMIGRRAIEHPWIFREARALLQTGIGLPKPTTDERFAVCREHIAGSVALAGERVGMRAARRRIGGYLRPLPGSEPVRETLLHCDTVAEADAALAEYEQTLRTSSDTKPVPSRSSQPRGRGLRGVDFDDDPGLDA